MEISADVIHLIALKLNVKWILSFSLTSKNIYKILNRIEFWKELYKRDFTIYKIGNKENYIEGFNRLKSKDKPRPELAAKFGFERIIEKEDIFDSVKVVEEACLSNIFLVIVDILINKKLLENLPEERLKSLVCQFLITGHLNLALQFMPELSNLGHNILDFSIGEALSNGHIEVVEYLSQYCVPDEQKSLTKIVLKQNIKGWNYWIENILPTASYNPNNVLLALILDSDITTNIFFEKIIELGADVNFGNGILINKAIEKKNIETIQFLIEKGANINNISNFDWIDKCSLSLFKLMREKGLLILKIIEKICCYQRYDFLHYLIDLDMENLVMIYDFGFHLTYHKLQNHYRPNLCHKILNKSFCNNKTRNNYCKTHCLDID